MEKVKKRFGIEYPLLIAGTSEKGDVVKSLPMLKNLLGYPTTIIIDKKGKVRFFETDFFGQGTGEHFIAYTRKFNDMIDGLLKEK